MEGSTVQMGGPKKGYKEGHNILEYFYNKSNINILIRTFNLQIVNVEMPVKYPTKVKYT